MQSDSEMLPVVVYTPESPLRHPLQLVGEISADIMAGRELAWRLLVRNLSAQYRQTVLGYLWALIPSLATTAVWVFLHSQKIVSFDTGQIPAAAFILIGMVLWQTFGDALQAPLRVITASKPMLAKVNFPRESLLIVAVGEVLFNFAVRSVLLVFVFLLFEVSVTSSVLLAPLGIGALILLGITLGLLVTPLGLLYHDVARGLSLILQFWLYLTPVIYALPQKGLASLLNYINPVSPLLSTTREWLVGVPAQYTLLFCLVVGVSAVLLLVGMIVYRVAMPIMIERMGA